MSGRIRNLRVVRTRKARKTPYKKPVEVKVVNQPRARGTSMLKANPQLFRNSQTVNMVYFDSFQTTSTSGVIAEQVYQLNDLHDVDYSNLGSNRQPHGYDQYTLYYTKYRVNSVKIEAIFTKATDSLVVGAFTVTSPDVTTLASLGTFRNAMEQPTAIGVTSDYSNYGNPRHILKSTVYPYKVLGVTKAKYDADDLYSGTFGSDVAYPVQKAYLHCGFVDVLGSTTCSGFWTIKMVFNVTMFQPKVINQS